MKNRILEFDKRKVDVSEIQEHVIFYIGKSDYGFKLLSDGDKKGAMGVLQEIRKIMKLEYAYYSKSKINDIILNDVNYNNYCSAIVDIIAHQTQTTSYKMLSSNLYDIGDYMRYYCSDMLKQKEDTSN